MSQTIANFFSIDHIPDRTVTHDGQTYRFFSGTSYLGLPQHPYFQDLMIASVRQYGTVFGSSRNGNLRLDIYEEAEARLAAMIGAPAALTLSSGMMAGQVVANWLRAQNATFIYGPKTHPALWHSPTVTLPNATFADWSEQVAGEVSDIAIESDQPIAILVNSIEAVHSQHLSFDWINTLHDEVPVTLVVDDSHGLGVLNNGLGIWPELPHKPNVTLLVTASLAKAMGLPGGAIFGEADTLRSIRQTAFFGGCSPMAPANLHAFLQAETLYAEQIARLQRNVALAEQYLLPTGLFQQANGYPVFFTEQNELYSFLLDKQILIYSFSYPTAADRANTRIVISAFHEPDDILFLAEQIAAFSSL